MCLLLVALDTHPAYRLVVGANRDEFFDRPTRKAGFWPDAPTVLAGRDERAGGTWLGMRTDGTLAAVTNLWEGESPPPVDAISRGRLVADYLRRGEAPDRYLARLVGDRVRYQAFNIVLGVPDDLWYYSNRGGPPSRLQHGVHGMSNGLLGVPWPKVRRGVAALTALLARERIDPQELLAVLADRETPGADELAGLPMEAGVSDGRASGPEAPTGGRVGAPSGPDDAARVPALAPVFIATPEFGTRCSTALLVGRDDRVAFVERSFGAGGAVTGEVRHEFALAPRSR